MRAICMSMQVTNAHRSDAENGTSRSSAAVKAAYLAMTKDPSSEDVGTMR
jgi:hypothetical protein